MRETSNHLSYGVDRGYFRREDVDRLHLLARRASAAVTRLIKYLQTAKPPPPNPL
jgi:hypothetical protein